MSELQPTAAPTLTTSLFGGAPTQGATTQNDASSQGSIYLFKSNNCSSPLSDTATPLILGQCLNMPLNDIASVEINTLPSCPDNGTPLLFVSDRIDCKDSTAGTSPDSGETLSCLTFGGGEVEVSLGSVVFECFSNGISSVAPSAAATSSAAAGTIYVYGNTAVPTSNTDSSNSSTSCHEGCDVCCAGCWAWIGVVAFIILIGACAS